MSIVCLASAWNCWGSGVPTVCPLCAWPLPGIAGVLGVPTVCPFCVLLLPGTAGVLGVPIVYPLCAWPLPMTSGVLGVPTRWPLFDWLLPGTAGVLGVPIRCLAIALMLRWQVCSLCLAVDVNLNDIPWVKWKISFFTHWNASCWDGSEIRCFRCW